MKSLFYGLLLTLIMLFISSDLMAAEVTDGCWLPEDEEIEVTMPETV